MQSNSTQLLPLRDIHEPMPVSWWPLSPAMWGLIALSVLAVVALIWWLQRRRKARRFYREALHTLDALERRYNEHCDLQRHLNEISIFLRRLLISRRNNRDISRLRGEAWCDYLNAIIYRSGVKQPVYFSNAEFRLMDKAVYRKTLANDQIDTVRLKQSMLQLINALSLQKRDRSGENAIEGPIPARGQA